MAGLAEHAVSVIATRTADHAPAYRALCSSCSWKGRRYPFERRALAEAQGRQHAEYHAEAARLAAGARGEGEVRG